MESLHHFSSRRLLSLILSLVIVTTTILTAIPVSAATDHNSGSNVDLDATYGTLIKTSIQGEYDYKAAFEVLEIVNKERKKAGLKPLTMDKDLLESAMQRAAECAVYYSHTRPNGELCFTTIKQYTTAGENIAAGYPSAASVMDGWIHSPGHRSNILDEKKLGFQSIGVGVFKKDGVYYWCQLFTKQNKQQKATQKKAVNKTVTIEARTKLVDLSINQKKLTLKSGKTATLEVQNRNLSIPAPYVYSSLDSSGLKFTSANTKVATVSKAGVVTPVGGGSTTIKVQSANGVLLFSVPVTAESKNVKLSLTTTSTGKPKIDWGKVTGATTYKVYKSEYKSGKWTTAKLLKSTSSLTYTDSSATSGTKTKYTVYAYNGKKEISSASVTTMYLAQPTAKVTNGVTGAKVTWNKVTGATSYKVYKSEYKNGKWSDYKAYATAKGTSYTDTKVKSGQKVRYTVYAYNGSYKSAEKAGVTTTYLSQPKVKLTKATKGVKISWGKVTGATSYKVYKSEYKNGKWTTYKVCKTLSGTAYTDTSVKSKAKVRYTVYAYSGSYKSAEKTGVTITR